MKIQKRYTVRSEPGGKPVRVKTALGLVALPPLTVGQTHWRIAGVADVYPDGRVESLTPPPPRT
jgi:hypothetical protein